MEPTYKPNWEISGGAVEEDEAPWETVRRELCEEIGWDRPAGRLLLVDYVRPQDGRPEGVVFLFDGGVLSDSDVAGMVLHPGEIRSAGFYALDEAATKVKPLLADRLAAEKVLLALLVCPSRRRSAPTSRPYYPASASPAGPPQVTPWAHW